MKDVQGKKPFLIKLTSRMSITN